MGWFHMYDILIREQWDELTRFYEELEDKKPFEFMLNQAAETAVLNDFLPMKTVKAVFRKFVSAEAADEFERNYLIRYELQYFD